MRPESRKSVVLAGKLAISENVPATPSFRSSLKPVSAVELSAHVRPDASVDVVPIIRQVVDVSRRTGVRHRFLFLENYDMRLARALVQGDQAPDIEGAVVAEDEPAVVPRRSGSSSASRCVIVVRTERPSPRPRGACSCSA